MRLQLAFILLLFSTPAFALNHGFDPYSPTVHWFESLKIPPKNTVPCCGKADAYAVDRYEKLSDGSYKVWIADGSAIQYPDGSHRVPWDESVPIIVPPDKVNDEQDDIDNPTKHSWIFFIPVREYPADGSVKPSTKVSTIYCFIRHPNGT